MPESLYTTGPESESITKTCPQWRVVERPGRSGGRYLEIAISRGAIRNINMTNLEGAHRDEVIEAARRLGEPTIEEWIDLRALAADRRFSIQPFLVEGINSYWSEDLPWTRPHRFASVVAELVEEKLLGEGQGDLGDRKRNLSDLIAREVLGVKPLIPRNVSQPAQALQVLISRLTALVKKRTFVPQENEQHLPGVEDPALDRVEARATIEAIATHLDSIGDVSSTFGARFLRQPDLWDLSRSEQADGLGVSSEAWRQAWHRVVVRLTQNALIENGST